MVRFEGHVAKFMGAALLADFGWPKAQEDEAERAVRSGLAIVESVVATTATGSGEVLAARVSIATGLVVVGDLVGEGAARKESVVGETLNAARLCLADRLAVAIAAHDQSAGAAAMLAKMISVMNGFATPRSGPSWQRSLQCPMTASPRPPPPLP